ncbi:MAG TPA: 2Fe-2S iron-sulfur cluster binding domain-containing protein [Clostridiales bacterium]|nr:2Fe-2S iron-sulfur cluster binding domain-containing protein [Clostridiales bacterium]
MLSEVLRTVSIVSGISVFLAGLLTLAEKFLLNYGTCRININNARQIEVKGGNSLLRSLMQSDIFIPSACGGRGSCGLCKVKVLEGGGMVLPTEIPYLTEEELKGNIRLSCQVKVREDIAIEIPEELFNIREYTATVEKIIDLTHDIKTLYLKFNDGDELSFKAGQYVQIKVPRYGKVRDEVYRAYSIASSPRNRKEIQLIIRRVPQGICTTYIFDYLKEGDKIVLNGAYGEFYLRDTDREIVCIAGGSGLAPIKSILHQMHEEGINRKATFFFGCVSKRDLYYVDEMKVFESLIPNFRFIPALSGPKEEDNWTGETGLITEVVDRYITDGSNMEAYLCGSPGMIDACIRVLRSKGMPEDRIYYDKF